MSRVAGAAAKLSVLAPRPHHAGMSFRCDEQEVRPRVLAFEAPAT